MAKQSPLQRVKAEFGSKAELAKKVAALLDRPEGEEAAAFEKRVSNLSNTKLLRLLEANKLVQSKFGSKDKLVDAIVRARFSGGNVDYGKKISGFTLPKLLDLARQHDLVRPSELR
ncbi:MAG: hypothetical protein H0U74_07390 [Bradymonadaceae bacterium]|nr:hypothetical protein [Lujinxingiaceae bacterium]